jgi:hypothetical protein
MWIRDSGWEKFGSGMEKIRIRDKHPGSATLPISKVYHESGWIAVCGILGLDPHFVGICGFAYRLPDADVLSINYRYRTKSDKFLKLV